MAPHVPYRSAGDLARALAKIWSRAAGRSGRLLVSGGADADS